MQATDIDWDFHFTGEDNQEQEGVLEVNPEIESRVLHLLIYAQNYISFLTEHWQAANLNYRTATFIERNKKYWLKTAEGAYLEL